MMTDEEFEAIQQRNAKRRKNYGESQQSADGEVWTVGAEDDIDALVAQVMCLRTVNGFMERPPRIELIVTLLDEACERAGKNYSLTITDKTKPGSDRSDA